MSDRIDVLEAQIRVLPPDRFRGQPAFEGTFEGTHERTHFDPRIFTRLVIGADDDVGGPVTDLRYRDERAPERAAVEPDAHAGERLVRETLQAHGPRSELREVDRGLCAGRRREKRDYRPRKPRHTFATHRPTAHASLRARKRSAIFIAASTSLIPSSVMSRCRSAFSSFSVIASAR
jgi:hypothetical protein